MSRAKDANGLTTQQENFCKEFVVCGDASEAYRRTYSTKNMKPKTIWNKASALASKGEVRARIEQLKAPALKKFNVTRERIIGELARIGFSDMRDLVEWDATHITIKDSRNISDDAAACIAEISETLTPKGATKKIKLHNKVTALVKLGEDLGMFKGSGGGQESDTTSLVRTIIEAMKP